MTVIRPILPLKRPQMDCFSPSDTVKMVPREMPRAPRRSRTSCASSFRPRLASQYGDSGTTLYRTMPHRLASALTAMTQRQPCPPIRAAVPRAARIPIGHPAAR